jgi:hypothetical protein
MDRRMVSDTENDKFEFAKKIYMRITKKIDKEIKKNDLWKGIQTRAEVSKSSYQ